MIGRRLMFFAKPLQRSNLCASHRQRRWLTHGESAPGWSCSMRVDSALRALRFRTPERDSTSSWSAARLVEPAENTVKCSTLRSRPPGTCGRRLAPSWSSTRFGITWSIRSRRSGCARPGRWGETNETSRMRSRSRTAAANGRCHPVPAPARHVHATAARLGRIPPSSPRARHT